MRVSWRRSLVWLRSIHAKLFIVTALVTSALTIIVAVSVSRNHRREMLDYTKSLAIETSRAVETEVLQRWEQDKDLKDPRKIEEFLESLAGPDRAVFQVDVFKREGRGNTVVLLTSSAEDETVQFGSEIGSYLDIPGPQAVPVELNTGDKGWKVYLPIRKPGRSAIGLVRTYIDLERWEVIDRANLSRTIRLLPPIVLGEFILLWVILGAILSDPLKKITEAMQRLEQGDLEAKAEVQRQDELGQIARRFNMMAHQLRRASAEREALIQEIQGLNANLQDRIDAALAELQAKNQELEQLVERNALLREELSQQERLAVAGQLTAAFAHEVGTPLNLVNSHLQLLQTQTDLSDRTRERVGTIQAQIERVSGIVRKLLGHTRRPRLQQEPVRLHTLLEDLQRLWTPTLASHQVTFHAEAPDPCLLFVDRKQMEQLFINLVNNAVDAMPEGGAIRLQVEAEVGSSPAQPQWLVSVSDEGTGIPPDILPQVFKPMFTTKPEGKGTGLGLAIVREIVRAHGGEVRIESAEGQGARVIFTLPGVPALVELPTPA